MENVIDFLATKEVLIVLAIMGVILAVYFVLWFMEFMKKHEEKKKLQNNTIELNKMVLEEINKKANESSNKIETPKKEEIKVEEKPIEVNNVNTNNINEQVKTEVLEVPDIVPTVKENNQVTTDNLVVTPVEVKPVVVDAPKEELVPNDNILLNNQFNEEVKVVEPEVITPVTAPKNEEEVIKYKDEVYTKSEAKEELERITNELKKLNEEEKQNVELTKYETEQEENAIISLDELLAKGKTLVEQNEVTQYQDDGNEPISISELEERYRNKEENVEVLDTEDEVKEERPKVSIDDFLSANKETVQAYQNKSTYHPSPIISPIYGIEKEPVNKNTTLELENTANYQKFDEEIRKTNEFLSKLKELQQKLD